MGGSLIREVFPKDLGLQCSLQLKTGYAPAFKRATGSQSGLGGFIFIMLKCVNVSLVVFSASLSLENSQDVCLLLSHLIENKMQLCGKIISTHYHQHRCSFVSLRLKWIVMNFEAQCSHRVFTWASMNVMRAHLYDLVAVKKLKSSRITQHFIRSICFPSLSLLSLYPLLM